MSHTCPRRGTVVEPDREGHPADRPVTPYPPAGWEHVAPDGAVEGADGVRFEDAEEIEGETVGERVERSRGPGR